MAGKAPFGIVGQTGFAAEALSDVAEDLIQPAQGLEPVVPVVQPPVEFVGILETAEQAMAFDGGDHRFHAVAAASFLPKLPEEMTLSISSSQRAGSASQHQVMDLVRPRCR